MIYQTKGFLIVMHRGDGSIPALCEVIRDTDSDEQWVKALDLQQDKLRQQYETKEYSIDLFFASSAYRLPLLRNCPTEVQKVTIKATEVLA